MKMDDEFYLETQDTSVEELLALLQPVGWDFTSGEPLVAIVIDFGDE
jgi:hypothetical protein